MRTRLALVALAAIALLAGCTGADDTASLSAKDILARAKAALATASSYHVAGAAAAGLSGTVDLNVSGQNFAGSVNLGEPDLTLKIDLIVVGSDVWVKVPDEFLVDLLGSFGGDPAVAAQVKGKYFKGGTGLPFGSLDEVKAMPQSLIPDGEVTKGEQSTVNGTAVIALNYPDKSILYVATKGEPYPVQMVDPDGNKIDFSQFGTAPAVAAPPASEVIDESKLALPTPTK